MIERLLNIQEATYASKLSIENLRKRIGDLYGEKELHVTGQQVNENEFSAADKFLVIGWNTPNTKRNSAYLKGKIASGESGSLVNLNIKPNSILPVFAILSFLGGFVISILSLSDVMHNKYSLEFGIVLLVLGLVYYTVSIVLRNRLKGKIVKYLELKKV